jgi:outer membrane biosynthesis protein TonB
MIDFIEEFWPVAMFFIIAGISYARNAAAIKRRAEEVEQEQPEVLGDEFPPIEPFEEIFTVQQPVEPVQKPKPKPLKREAIHRPQAHVRPEAAPAEAPKKESQYAIKSKSDAKRAIIYSEIFNRKYN